MLPAGDCPWWSISWVRSPSADHGESTALPLILQAVVDNQLYLIDVDAFVTSFKEDGNFSLEQLNRVSDNDPDAIPSLLKQWPHVVNFRDEETGDTVLHHCARTGKAEATRQWLSGTIPPAQLDNQGTYSLPLCLAVGVKNVLFLNIIQPATNYIYINSTPIMLKVWGPSTTCVPYSQDC